MSSEYVEIKYISYTTVLWFSKKFILLFVPESFSMIILSYPFSKVLFSPTFLHRISFRKKTGRLAEHDFVLICRMSTFQHSYQSWTGNIGEIKYTFWGAISRYIVIHPHNAYEHSAYSFKMRTCNYKILKIMKLQKYKRLQTIKKLLRFFKICEDHLKMIFAAFAKLLCGGWFLHLLHRELLHCRVTNLKRNVKFRWRRPMQV